MDDFSAVAQIIDKVTIAGLLFWAWTGERKERQALQAEVKALNSEYRADLKEFVNDCGARAWASKEYPINTDD